MCCGPTHIWRLLEHVCAFIAIPTTHRWGAYHFDITKLEKRSLVHITNNVHIRKHPLGNATVCEHSGPCRALNKRTTLSLRIWNFRWNFRRGIGNCYKFTERITSNWLQLHSSSERCQSEYYLYSVLEVLVKTVCYFYNLSLREKNLKTLKRYLFKARDFLISWRIINRTRMKKSGSSKYKKLHTRLNVVKSIKNNTVVTFNT